MSRFALNIVRRLVPVLLLLVLWQLAGTFGWSNVSLIPSPTQVASAIQEMISSGQLFHDAVASLQRVLLGFAAAVFAGCVVGALISWLANHADWLNSPLELLRPIPPIAWIPLAILWFGIGEAPAYFIVFLGAFFPVLTNVVAGIRSTERLHINAALCLGANRGLILREVILPSALPSILIGLRVGFGVAWICVITAELVGAQSGLGYMIQLNRLLLRTDKVVAGMVVIGCLGFAFNQILVLLERKLVRWRIASALG
jgi:NitT/TauT family transport system permease protein/sulfonate transport system permease protein